MAEKYSKQEEYALFAQVAAGNREAEEALALRYSRLVRACARPYFLAGGDSEDLTQEGMFGLLSAIREYDPSEQVPFQAYAETCIRNRLRSAIRAASRLKHQPLNQGVPIEAMMLEDEGSANKSKIAFRRGPEEMVLARERADEFNENIAQRLSAYEQEVLELFLRGLSYQEMAERTERSVKSVDNAVQRIRRKLARYYDLGEFSES